MWRLVLLLCSVVSVFAQERYPLSVEIVSVDIELSTVTNSVDTNCTSDSFGHTDCDSTPSKQSVTTIKHTAKASDGNTYVIANGPRINIGTYKARVAKDHLIIGYVDKHGKPKEWIFNILSVRKG